MNLKERLYEWRDREANSRGIELWRILPNRALDEIADREPRSLRELALIGGVGPTKLAVFGRKIVEIVEGKIEESNPKKAEVTREEIAPQEPTVRGPASPPVKNEKPSISVGFFLEHINRALRTVPARVRGEVTQFKFQGNAYFTLKDKDDDAVLDVMMFARDFQIAGIDIKAGMEVVVEGFTEVYKPWGRFSFKAKTVEFAGEGVLKKQYEELKKKLDREGLFAEVRKRPLPLFPSKIGVITSRTGAVIEDFLNNLGRYGFEISMMDTRVEGAAAAMSVLSSIEAMRNRDVDVLVIIRGGGSFESLQAFNNEHVVRAIREFGEKKAPVICAIGHDQDRPLAQMVADFAPSTPTASAELLNDSWDRALAEVDLHQERIFSAYQMSLGRRLREIDQARFFLGKKFSELEAIVENAAQGVRDCVPRITLQIDRFASLLISSRTEMVRIVDFSMSRMRTLFDQMHAVLDAHDPMRQLRLGYSVARNAGKVVRAVGDIHIGDMIELQISDGVVDARIEQIHGSKKVGK